MEVELSTDELERLHAKVDELHGVLKDVDCGKVSFICSNRLEVVGGVSFTIKPYRSILGGTVSSARGHESKGVSKLP